MATVYSDFYTPGGVPKYNVTVPIIGATYEIATALSAADIVTMVRVPANFTIWHGWLMGDDIDTGTETLELDVGIAGNTDKFLNSGVITGDAVTGIKPETGILYPLFGGGSELPWTPAEATDVIITVTAAAAAGGTGTLSLFLYGNYLEPNQ
ncbi:MAG TPA: hypothetical protein VIG24_12460 [Acidimicrobiia bacterium]